MHTRSTSALFAAFLVCLAACSSSQQRPTDTVAIASDSGEAQPNDPPSKSVDTSSLSTRERSTYERMLGTTYAPCPDQAVTLDICLAENRPCYACKPASRFLAARVKAGLSASDVQRAYSLRFGSDVRQVDVADSPTKGPQNAPVTVIVWSDFECPACKRVLPLIDSVVKAHEKEVRLVHKLYPLPRHPHSEIAARAAYAAKLQGKYWEMEHELFEHQSSLSEETIKSIAEELNLDMRKFQADAQSPAAKKVIDRDMADADRSGLSGTPFILINGRELDFSLFHPETDLDAWIQMELELVKAKSAR